MKTIVCWECLEKSAQKGCIWKIELCVPTWFFKSGASTVGSWSSGIGSLRHNTVHIWGEPGESRVLLDPKQWCPASRPALRWCEVYAWHQKIRFRSTKTLHRAGSGVAHSGGYVLLVRCCTATFTYRINSLSVRANKSVINSSPNCALAGLCRLVTRRSAHCQTSRKLCISSICIWSCRLISHELHHFLAL